MKRRVLVVDDEKGIREAMKQLLEFEEIDVETAASGSEALKQYTDFQRAGALVEALTHEASTTVETVDLMQSTLQSGGAVYQVRHRERVS